MIAFIRGTARVVKADYVVIDNGGIGYRVNATATTLAEVRTGEVVELSTSFIVREESMTLYGFATEEERDVFDTLLTVSGIGPKIALAVLSVFTPDKLQEAVSSQSVTDLTQVPGIGKKGAQRMILELGSKLAPFQGQAGESTSASVRDVVEALVGLGWNESDAAAAVAEVEKEHGSKPVAVMLRLSLQHLGRR